MNNVETHLAAIERDMAQGVSYPESLLSKIDRSTPFGQEHYDYIVRGGEGGGYFHWLTLYMKHVQPRTVVELGNRYGLSTLALYHALPKETSLYSVDIVKDLRLVPETLFQDKRVHFVFGDSRDLSLYEPLPVDVDFWWSDTIHIDRQIRSEFYVWEPLLADEAVIAIDDINLNDKRVFFDQSPHAKWDLTRLCHVSGFGIIHYRRPDAERGADPAARRQEALRRSAHIGYSDAAVLDERITDLLGSPYERARAKWSRVKKRLWPR
jgi:hypothetical protein